VVLPFTNLSPDPDNAYFADGLTDEVITDLSKVRSLRVIARNSALQLRGTTKDSATIARELKVRYVLEGSVRRAGNALRITAQLVDGRSNSQLWADKYGGTMDDVFELQEKLSRSIVDALAIALSPEEDQRIAARPIADPRVLECYQRARVGVWSTTREGLESARVLLEQGMSILGENTLLLAAMANLEWSYVNWGIDPNERRLARAVELANRALTLDSGVAQAHAVLAFIKMSRGPVREAWSHARRAVDLEPNDAEVLLILCNLLFFFGKEGMREVAEQVVAIDPLSPMSWACRSSAAWSSARFDDALADLEQARRLDPGESPVYRVAHALTLTFAGRRAEATALVTGDHSDQPGFEAFGTLLRLALAGDAPSFRATLTPALTAWIRGDLHWSWHLAQLFALLGDAEAAIDWLGNAVDRGFVNYPLLATVDPLLAPLRSDPRFQALMERTRVAWEAVVAETAE
jgi:TolB-like protein